MTAYAGLHPGGALRQRFAALGGRTNEGELLSRWLVQLREHDLGEEAVFVAYELARSSGVTDWEDRCALLHLLAASWIHRRQGSTRLPLPDTPEGEAVWRALLDLLAAGPEVRVRLCALLAEPEKLAPILGRPGDYKPLILEGNALYHQVLHQCEVRLAEGLRARLGRGAVSFSSDAAAALADVLARPAVTTAGAIRLSREQQQAVTRAAIWPLSLITGGPGTGKTSIVVALLRVWLRLGLAVGQVALAAPTGKAAYRLGESVRAGLARIVAPSAEDALLSSAPPTALTLHRLLGYHPETDRFAHHQANRLPQRVILVDECSMVDLDMMDRLVRALRDDALLVLLGDAHQLPSVDAGSVFRELVAWGCAPRSDGSMPGGGIVCELTHGYRQEDSDEDAQQIRDLAERVRCGDAAGALAQLSDRRCSTIAGALEQPGVAWLSSDQAGLEEFLLAWQQRRAKSREWIEGIGHRYVCRPEGLMADDWTPLEGIFRALERQQVLCLTREHGGSDALNQWLHARVVAATKPSAKAAGFAPGEPLIILRNDYRRGLFNGDLGVVLEVEDERGVEPQAVFSRAHGFAAFPIEQLAGELGSAYALTVHRAQGSEYDEVALVLPSRDLPLLTREILYTALSRARRSVVILGSGELLARGVGRSGERFSSIAERLRDA